MGCSGSHTLFVNQIKGTDVLPDQAKGQIFNSNLTNEVINFNIRLLKLHMTQLRVKQQCFLKFTFKEKNTEIYSTQTRTTNLNEKSPIFDLNCEFEHNSTLEDLEKGHLEICLYPLNDHNEKEPISVVMIDFLALAFGPSHHSIKFFTKNKRNCIGILQYNIHFEQVCKTKISLKTMQIKVLSIKKELPISCSFKLIKPDTKYDSSMSGSKIGKYDTCKKRTQVDFNFMAHNSGGPTLSTVSTMEDLMASSLQVLVWKDSRTMKGNEGIRSVMTKNLSSALDLNSVDIHFGNSYSSSSDENSSGEGSANSSEEELKSEVADEPSSEMATSQEGSEDDASQGSDDDVSEGRDTVSSDHGERYELLGETHIEFAAILKNIIQFVDRLGKGVLAEDSGTISIGQARRIEITVDDLKCNKWDINKEDLWYFGRKIGEISLKIEANNLPYVRQLPAGVLTEKGVRAASVRHVQEFASDGAAKKHLPETMRDALDYLADFKKRDCKKGGNERVPLSRMETICKEVITCLKHTTKTSIVYDEYVSVAAEMKAQEILINLAGHCLTYVDFVDPRLKGKYFEIISLVFHRGELDLNQIGILRSEGKDNNSKIIKEKKKLMPSYQFLIYEALNFSIDKLTRKAVDFYRRDCIVFCIAISYFKIPEFRKSFLDAISMKPIPEIEELRSIDINRENDDNAHKAYIDEFFNWKKYFYDKIPESPQKKKNMEIIAKILAEKRWEEKLGKRGVAFFLIAARWAEYAKTIAVDEKIDWFDIPGYSIILKAVLTEFKERKISEYPDALVDATCALIADEKVLRAFIEIIFEKTNIHIPSNVNRTLDIVEKWFHIIAHDEKRFPANFDDNFFYKAIDMLINYEHAVSTPKCLWLMYKTFHIFPLHMQKRLAEMLFIKKFNKLFFSWSWNIRTVYYKLYLYQLQHVFGKGLENDTPDESQSKRVKRSKSSANFRFVKLELITKNMTGNKTTNKQSLYEDENKRIKELVQIAHSRQLIIDEYLKEYQAEEKLDYREYVDDTSDEEDSENDTIHESKIAHLIKEIPDKYKHYVNDSIKDFLEEQKLYDKWEKGEKDEEQDDGLPEIELQAVLDESENPDVDLDGNDGW